MADDLRDDRSDRSSVALRGLVHELRASNDEKQRRVSMMHAELQDMRARAAVPEPPRVPFEERLLGGFASPGPDPQGPLYSPPRRARTPEKWSPEEAQRIVAERGASLDAALWAVLENEEAAWESGSVPPVVPLEITDAESQLCEVRVLELLETYREVVRRLDSAQTESRVQVISAVAQRSQEQCAESLLRELAVAWGEWRDREVLAERDHAQVQTEIEDLQRRLSALELEERAAMEAVARIKSVRLVSQHEMTVLQVELNQVRTGMRQHEAEFLSRKAEDEAKIAQGQEQLETLTRELGLLRQRHLQEATEVREQQTKLAEIGRQKTKELEQYKRAVLPMIQEYNVRRANDTQSVSARCAQLRELSDRHRQELMDLARPMG